MLGEQKTYFVPVPSLVQNSGFKLVKKLMLVLKLQQQTRTSLILQINLLLPPKWPASELLCRVGSGLWRVALVRWHAQTCTWILTHLSVGTRCTYLSFKEPPRVKFLKMLLSFILCCATLRLLAEYKQTKNVFQFPLQWL